MKRSTKGFTLIELLIVVVIIGILAAIAIPKFASTKQKAYLATMKTDLRNLATAEEGWASNHSGAYSANATYDNTAGTLTADSLGYVPSAGVKVVITNAGAGWSAIATHASTGTTKCAIFVNTTAVSPAVSEGAPACQ